MKKYFLPLIAIVFFSCSQESETENVSEVITTIETAEETWLFKITLNDSVQLPIKVTSVKGDELNFTIHNAEEKIALKNIHLKGDSIFMEMPVFQTGFEGVYDGTTMSGVLVKYDAVDYRLPFTAHKIDELVPILQNPCCDINKRYKVLFRPGQENEGHAIGEFKQEGNTVSGTFMTETGDYRYLGGTLEGNLMRLSAFDGNHLYVFKATVSEDGSMEGMFFSGKTRADKWTAEINDEFKLADPDKLTYLKEGESELSFTFNTTSDETIEYTKEKYLGKVVILQILGSWCPNCMDESKFLQEQYAKHNEEGLEIIGLAFERKRDKGISYKAIDKMVEDLEMTYPVVFAGSTRMADREKALPQLNKIMSFPTSIYINKKGEIVKIHTGFAGPGTTEYDSFVTETEELIQTMLSE
jgi:thiol-disulfide isomerase/thioredoxin